MGGQKKSPHGVPQWCADCFELKRTFTAGSRETSAPSWNRLELELGVLSVMRDYHNNLLGPPTWQGKPLFHEPLFFSSPCNDPLKSPRHLSSSLAQNGLYTQIPVYLGAPPASGASDCHAPTFPRIRRVDMRNVQTSREFLCVYLSQTGGSCGKRDLHG